MQIAGSTTNHVAPDAFVLGACQEPLPTKRFPTLLNAPLRSADRTNASGPTFCRFSPGIVL
jgi:hypothetical protein